MRRIKSQLQENGDEEPKPEALQQGFSEDKEMAFWWACAKFEENYAEAKEYLVTALKDTDDDENILTRNKKLISLQMKVWCHAKLLEFNEAHETLDRLIDELHIRENKMKIGRLHGYIKALEQHQINSSEMLLQFTFFSEEESDYLEESPLSPPIQTSNIIQKGIPIDIAIALTQRGAELTSEKIL
jgi:hypothetical protein